MKIKRTVSFLLLIFVCMGISYSQCPFEKTCKDTCYGECGMFEDNNGDDICDVPCKYAKQNSPKQQTENHQTKTQKISAANQQETIDTAAITNDSIQIVVVNNSIKVEAAVEEETIATPSTTIITEKPKRHTYPLWEFVLATLGLYLLTWTLTKCKVIKKYVHRRIWNTVLLLTFLISCLLGLLLTIDINYNWLNLKGHYLQFLHWHVEFGVSMTVTGLLHALWHWKYFKNLFHKLKK